MCSLLEKLVNKAELCENNNFLVEDVNAAEETIIGNAIHCLEIHGRGEKGECFLPTFSLTRN